MRRKKVVKLSTEQLDKMKSVKTHVLSCKGTHCERDVECDSDTIEILCWKCTTQLAPPAPNLLRSQAEILKERAEKAKFPRGWKLMKSFILEDGTVYEYGIENIKLKGQLPPTDVEAIRKKQKLNKKSKREKREIEDNRDEKLAKMYLKKKTIIKDKKRSKSSKSFSDKKQIFAVITQGDRGLYKAIGDGINYTELVNDQKKLKYVFNNSKKIMGKRNKDGTYKWRGCK